MPAPDATAVSVLLPDDPAREALIRRTLATPAASRLGLSLTAAAPGTVEIALAHDPANRTEGDVIHGGVIATLADIAGVATAISGVRDLPSGGGTGSIAISYLRPAVACDLLARGTLLRGGGRQSVVRVSISAPDDTLVAEAQVTVSLR